MSEPVAETKAVTRDWCPLCEPEVDPLRELVIEARCGEHRPGTSGPDDSKLVGFGCGLSGGGDIDSETNAAMNDLLYRRQRLLR